MRVIAGKFKGKQLKALPKNRVLRPTSDRVKESIFALLGTGIKGKRVLDLFAGSGALGIEALSRGAKSVTFIDNNPKCIKVLRENITRVKDPGGLKNKRPPGSLRGLKNKRPPGSLIKTDASRAIKKFGANKDVFDIIILDPPYYKGLVKKCLHEIEAYGIIANSGLILAEHSIKDELPEEVGRLRLIKTRKYGDTRISIYENAGSISGQL